MRKMTDEQIRRAISNVGATLAVEGLKPSRRVAEYGERYFRDEINIEEAVNMTMKGILEKKQQLTRI